MKVLLRKRIRKLGTIGDVVEVKPGYARNYLLPHGLAIMPTEANLKRIEHEKAAYLAQLAKEKEHLEARAAVLAGKEITITARANETGHLYGSIGPAQIAYALNEMDIPVSPDEIRLPEAIRQLDKYDVTVELDDDIHATIHVWIVPLHEPGEGVEPSMFAAGDTEDEPAAEQAGDPETGAIADAETGDIDTQEEAPPAPEIAAEEEASGEDQTAPS